MPDGTIGRATSETPIDLSAVPEDYHEFADIFNKGIADTLSPHQDYDLKIDLKGGAPPSNCIYSLSPSELETLQELWPQLYYQERSLPLTLTFKSP